MIYQVIEMKERFPFLGVDGRSPTLTAYLPDPMVEMGRQNEKRPCLLICPGGGYACVSDREAEPIAFHFLPEGYNVFVLRYSIAPHTFPVQLREVAAAMELIYENAELWHSDPSKVAIMGFSAGGHLAAHYSTSYGLPEIRQVFPDSKPVQASILCYPVISADEKIAHLGSFRNLLGTNTLTPEQVRQFSCENLVSSNTPPAFIWHTAEDQAVPVENSLCYASSLSAYHIPFSLHIYPKGWHGLATVDGQTNNDLPEDIRWAAQWLNGAKKWLRILFA